MADAKIETNRYFLKDRIRLEVNFSQTDQSRGVAPPPLEKPCDPGARRVALTPPGEWTCRPAADVVTAIRDRRSHRRFRGEALTLDEVSYLLWATQGITHRLNAASALRTVPSAGCRHALETYVCALNVEGLAEGIYRFLPVENELAEIERCHDLRLRLDEATLGQRFIGAAAVTFAWTAIPYRMEWRYGLAAHKVIALDAGHVCQNLYLACAAIGAGTCAVAAYHQQLMDALLGLDGDEEFTIYLAPIGKIGPGRGG